VCRPVKVGIPRQNLPFAIHEAFFGQESRWNFCGEDSPGERPPLEAFEPHTTAQDRLLAHRPSGSIETPKRLFQSARICIASTWRKVIGLSHSDDTAHDGDQTAHDRSHDPQPAQPWKGTHSLHRVSPTYKSIGHKARIRTAVRCRTTFPGLVLHNRPVRLVLRP
jgi:hypothetical protein